MSALFLFNLLPYVLTLPPIHRMAAANKLPIRLYLMAHSSASAYWASEIPTISPSESADGRVMLRAVKIFGDGALGSWGSAMIEPYTDKPESKGILRSSPEVFEDLIGRFYADVGATSEPGVWPY